MSSKDAVLSDSSDSENEKKILAQLRKEKKSTKRKLAGAAAGEPASKSAAKQTTPSEKKIALGKMKFVTVREFKNKLYVDIREHYEKDGQLLPGKKGVSLPAEQWQNFKAVIEEVDERLRQMS